MILRVSLTDGATEHRRKVQLNQLQVDMNPAGPEPVPFRIQVGFRLPVDAPETGNRFAEDPVVRPRAEHLLRREILQGGIGKGDEGFLVLLRAHHREEPGVGIAHGDVDKIVVFAFHHVGDGDLLRGLFDHLRIFLPQFVEFRHHLGDVQTVFRHFRRIGDGAFSLELCAEGMDSLQQ